MSARAACPAWRGHRADRGTLCVSASQRWSGICNLNSALSIDGMMTVSDRTTDASRKTGATGSEPDVRDCGAALCRQTQILVLDDDRTYLSVVERILALDGYSVLTASNHRCFLDCLHRNRLDLAILDINMPDVNGLDVYAGIRQEHAFPVLFVTGYPRSFSTAAPGVRKIWESNVSDGLTDILYKPYKTKLLRCKVAALVGGVQQASNGGEVHDDLAVTREVRKLLVRAWIDLGRLTISTSAGKISIDGAMHRLPDTGTGLQSGDVEQLIRAVRQVSCRMNCEVRLENWVLRDGAWQAAGN